MCIAASELAHDDSRRAELRGSERDIESLLWEILDTLGQAFFLLGELEKAIEVAQHALDHVSDDKLQVRETLLARLREYDAALAKSRATASRAQNQP